MGHEAFHPSHIRTFAFQSRYHGLLPRNGGENLEELPHKPQKAIHFSEAILQTGHSGKPTANYTVYKG